MTTYYKVLDANNRSCSGGNATWTPGEWMPAIEGDLMPCENGYHLCRRQDLSRWLGEAIWEAEADGDVVETEDKVVVRRARITRKLDTWNERIARLFACDCASKVLPIYERDYPNDPRPRNAIEVARRYANGEAADAERAAARDAAGDAAWAAARAAARDAAGAAAWAAAGDAARAAAGAAAWAAARAAAWDAAWEWQTARLFEYLYPVE